MSKDNFTDILKYGKCKCGDTGQKGHSCAASGAASCPCCEKCREQCENFIKDMNMVLSALLEEKES